jgi:hypothetical protein
MCFGKVLVVNGKLLNVGFSTPAKVFAVTLGNFRVERCSSRKAGASEVKVSL